MDAKRVVGTTLPHADFGAPDCCGCLNGVIRGEEAYIECNECSAIVRTVPVAELARTIHQMELSLDVATAQCPHCGTMHVAPGFSQLKTFICTHCGKAVTL